VLDFSRCETHGIDYIFGFGGGNAVLDAIRISLPSACPDAALFRHLAGQFAAAGP